MGFTISKNYIELEYIKEENKTLINRKIEFLRNWNAEQRTRLQKVAETCPIHKILNNPIEINTTSL